MTTRRDFLKAATLSGAAASILFFQITRYVQAEDADRQPTSAEGEFDAFLGEPELEIQQVHRGGRFPNIVVAMDGSVLALWGGVKLRRSEDGGQTWGPEIMVGGGFMGGGAIVNETNGEVLAFVEERHPRRFVARLQRFHGPPGRCRIYALVPHEYPNRALDISR